MSISFSDYGQWIGGYKTNGRARKAISDMVMLNTWSQDIQSQTAYLFDYYRDLQSEEALFLNDLHPQNDPYKIPIEIKFIRHGSQTYKQDPVTFWLQMQPGQECNVPYFDEVLGSRYDATFPVGLYVAIQDEAGKYNRWLVVAKANYEGNQFPTFELLRCDYVFQWIHDHKKYQCAGVLRSQNSYNSGIWEAYKTVQPQDQQMFAVPMTRDTETLFYNIRMIVDNKVRTEQRAWLISKVNRISHKGICSITMAQDTFNQHTDYIEKDEFGNIIGMWADFYKSNIEPTPIVPDVSDDDSTSISNFASTITCSGKNQIKVGGSTKTLTVSFTDNQGDPIEFQPGEWSFNLDDEPIPLDLITITDVAENKIKVKFHGGDEFIGKMLEAIYTSGDVVSSLRLEIIAL